MNPTATPKRKYEPKKYNNDGKYVIDKHQYPSDLMAPVERDAIDGKNLYGGNYVIFYINVNNDSKMVKNLEKNKDVFVNVGANERIKKNLVAKNYTKESIIALEAASGAGVGKIVSDPEKTNLTGTGALVGGALAVGLSQYTNFSRAQKRLKTTIALHVPNELSIRYGAGWQDGETFVAQALMEGGEAIKRALIDAGEAITDKDTSAVLSASEAFKGRSGEVSSIAGAIALRLSPNASALSVLSGLAPNPMKEQVFRGMDFRTFTMEYLFAPRDAGESRNVQNIINAFKYHMHPEYKDSNNFLFLYPSEFDIEYYSGNEENLNIHRHTSCALTDLNVNYTPNGSFSTFKDGCPTQIRMTLTFKELTILTKELIEEGL